MFGNLEGRVDEGLKEGLQGGRKRNSQGRHRINIETAWEARKDQGW